jgi:CHAT domain-containing protein
MFATHGLSAGSLDGLAQPALALTAPQIAGGGGDGLLTVDEILRLKLSADWVVLSACDTRRSRVSADADTVSALAGAFFYAGARALLVSNWPVETLSAKLLTVELFRRQAGTSTVSRAEALRQAMLDLIDAPGSTAPDTGKPLYRYAHPIFWGPFSLVGDPTP